MVLVLADVTSLVGGRDLEIFPGVGYTVYLRVFEGI